MYSKNVQRLSKSNLLKIELSRVGLIPKKHEYFYIFKIATIKYRNIKI